VNEVLDILSWICLGGGALLCVISAIGVTRFPEFYTRTHAASIGDTMGAGLIILGLMFQVAPYMVSADGAWQPDQWIMLAKLVFLGMFILFTSPTAGHALVKAAHAHGISWDIEQDSTSDDSLDDGPVTEEYALGGFTNTEDDS
jgi:multicomponent Na+:H+ antiporter subunit G